MSQIKRILIAEDERAFASVLQFVFSGAGYEVEWAPNGALAWEALQNRTFDLLIADYQMPQMDGLELCRLIRQNPALARLPIILITAKGYEIDFNTLREEFGLTATFLKPFSPHKVFRAVEACLQNQANLCESRS